MAAIAVATGTVVVAAQPAPQLAVQITPSTDLVDGQIVTVDVEGSVSNGEERVIQCVRGAANNESGSLDESKCDASTTLPVDADADGEFTTPYTVSASITVGGTSVNCVVVAACEIVMAYATHSGPPVFGVPIEFAGATPAPPSAEPGEANPQCPQPYSPVAYFSGAVDVPALPPGVSGRVVPYPEAGATVSVAPQAGALLVTVTLDGVTREFTTSPHAPGTNYDRTPGASDTGFGEVDLVYGGNGAIYVVLVQDNSGSYTRIGWRFDEPCEVAAVAVAGSPAFTG